MTSPERQQYIIGVDLGGTNIVVGAMTMDGSQHLSVRSIPTQSSLGDEGVANRIVTLVEQVILDTIKETGIARSDFIGVGVGAPGPLDRERGIVLVAPNLGWLNFKGNARVAQQFLTPWRGGSEHQHGTHSIDCRDRTVLCNPARCCTIAHYV